MTEIAAMAVVRGDAQALYPKDTPKDRERRDKYVEEHWRKVHPIVLAGLYKWKQRQRYVIHERRILPVLQNKWLNWIPGYKAFVLRFSHLAERKDTLIPKSQHWSQYLER